MQQWPTMADKQFTTIYLASPLGFSCEHAGYRQRIKERLRQQGCRVLDPWEQQNCVLEIKRAGDLLLWREREAAYRPVAAAIGTANEQMIREADSLLAVLDGLEVDSGTAAEVGFASALQKTCYGLRTDWRDSGDFPGLPFNLQVLHFIERTGGRLFRSIDEMLIPCSAETPP